MDTTYVLGHKDREIQRLVLHAEILVPIPTRLFHSAGIKPGIKILNLGCGAVDISLLAAKLTGPDATVTAIDSSEKAILFARERACQAGVKNIDFRITSLAEYEEEVNFDFAIGRYVLMFQADPVCFITKTAQLYLPGGVLAFDEIYPSGKPLNSSEMHLITQISEMLKNFFENKLTYADIPVWIGPLFSKAQLPAPDIFCELPVYYSQYKKIGFYLAETFCSFLADIAELSTKEVNMIPPEKMSDFLIKEREKYNPQVELWRQTCAWTRMPA